MTEEKRVLAAAHGGEALARPDRQRILIIKPSAMGDVATALPLLCDLKRAYPQAEIDWLVHPGWAALVEGHEAIHEVIYFERKKMAAWWWKPAAFKLFWGLLKKLRGRRYDLVVDAQGLLRSGFLARVTGAQVRIGFANAREGAKWFYTKRVKLPGDGKKMLAVDRMRALVGPLDISVKGAAEFRVPVREMDLERLGVPENYVVVVPGARWDTKRWSAEGYAEILRRLVGDGEHVVLVGSADERALCERLAANMPGVVSVAGKTNMAELVAVLARAQVVISNDTGPLHVAVALGRPVVGIYGPTDPEFVGPYGQMEHVVRFNGTGMDVQIEKVWGETRNMKRETRNMKHET